MSKRLITKQNGFTLIELMIVMSIIGILAAIAVPNYQWGLIKARETVLREDLYNLRSAIDQFYADNGKYPDTLEELTKKDKQYLREIPKDPFTDSKETWVTVLPPPPPPEAANQNIGIGIMTCTAAQIRSVLTTFLTMNGNSTPRSPLLCSER